MGWVGLQLPPIVVDLILKPKCCRNGVNDLTVRGGAIEVHCLNGSCEAASAKETIGYSYIHKASRHLLHTMNIFGIWALI